MSDDPLDPNAETLDFSFTLTLTLRDTEMLSAMQAAGRFPNLEAVIEQAIFHYAKHLQVGPVPADFMMYRRLLNASGRPWKGKTT